MIPCWPLMSNAAWRRFIGTHPHWRAPQTAPCGGKAAIAKLLGAVAMGGALAAGGAAVGYHAPDYIASLPPVAQCCAWQGGEEPRANGWSFGAVERQRGVDTLVGSTGWSGAPEGERHLVSGATVQVKPGLAGERTGHPIPVPEPSSLLIFGAAAVLVVAIKRRR